MLESRCDELINGRIIVLILFSISIETMYKPHTKVKLCSCSKLDPLIKGERFLKVANENL